MSSDSTSEDTSAASDTPVNLGNVFIHPAGLPTPRYLVEALVRDAERSAKGIASSQAHKISFPVTRPMSRPGNPLATDLKEILAFSEPQISMSDQRNAGTKGFDSSEDIGASERRLIEITPVSESSSIATPSGKSSSLIQLSPHSERTSSVTPPSLVKKSSVVERSLQLKSSSLRPSLTREFSSEMELDLPFGDSKHFSISNGEVSYGDEPVSNRKSRTTGSRESSYRSDESQSQSSGIDQETPRLSGQWFYLMNSPHSVPTFTSSSVNFHNSPDGSQGRSNLNTTNSIAYNTTSNATHNLLSRIDLPPNNTNRQSINYPTNFKPLTSIEKSDDSNSRLVLESSLSNSRPTDPAVSTNSLTSHKPVHIISSSSIGPGSYTELSPITQNPHGKMPTKKRKDELGGAPKAKKQKGNKIVIKSKRVPKSKAEKPEPARYRLDQTLWMRILEFTPPSFLFKARLINRKFRDIIDSFDSLFLNCCFENFGADMPLAPQGISPKQYMNLLQGKGCLDPGCKDKLTSKTSWSWAKRWCASCWKGKLEREDRVIKTRQNLYSRTALIQMLECIPVGMHDSFMKPHDFVEDLESRPRGAPRLYKYYLTEDINKIITEYEALAPPPYVEDSTQTAAEKSAALAAHQALMDALDEKRAEFLAKGKAKNDKHMATVMRIEAGVRRRRAIIRAPNDENRNSRRELFTRRAAEDIPWVTKDFLWNSKAFKAAVRIFRDGGTERGWLTLKPKILKEWEDRQEADKSGGNSMNQNDVVKDIESEEDKASYDNIQRRSQEYSQTLVDNLSRLGSLGVSQFPQQALQARMQLILQARAHMRQYGHSTSSLASRLTSSLGLGIGYGSSLTANAFQASSPSIPIGGNPFLLGNINSSVSHFQNRLPSSSTNNLSAPLMNHGLPSIASFPSIYASSSSIASFQSTHASMTASRNIPASNSTSNSASSSRSMSISSLLQQPQTPSPNQHYNPFA